MALVAPLMAIVLTLVAGAFLFSAWGANPFIAMYTFFIEPVNSVYGFTELLLKATPLVLCGIGLAVCFRANVWNIGAEGQLTAGALLGGGLALWLHASDSILLLPAMLLLGILGGMAWAAIVAWLKTRFNTNEILSSLMLTYVAALLLSFLVHGPWRDPAGFNFPQTRMFQDAATLPILIEGTRLHIGTLLAPLAVLIAWLLQSRGFLGFQLKVLGSAPAAADYAGFRQKRLTWTALLISGGLAGLTGVLEVAGPIGQLMPVISPGYGFTAIIVAFVGRLHPLGVLLAGLLLALTFLGAENAQISLGLPLAVTGVFQGMLLFFLLASEVLIRFRIVFSKAGRQQAPSS